MAGNSRFSPRQESWVARAERAVERLASLNGVPAWRGALAEDGLLAPDLGPEFGGAGGHLVDALTVAEVLGERLPRNITTAVMDGAPLRALALSDRSRALAPQVVAGQASVVLVDASALGVKLERRPASAPRLVGEIPPVAVPADARAFLFVFEERADWLAQAFVPSAHAALRADPIPDVPLVMASGVLDVEVPEADLVVDAHSAVSRALAAEDLLRAARALGEALALAQDGQGTPVMPVDLAVDRVALYAAAERLMDGGPHTLLGEDGRMGAAGAALEARALARRCLLDAVRRLTDVRAAAGARPGAAEWEGLSRAAPDPSRDVAHRLGEARQGAQPGMRARSTVRPADSRTPLPVTEGAITEVPAGGERRPGGAGRSTTARMASVAMEWGPLAFVPEPVRALQREARQLVVETQEALGAYWRDGTWPTGVLDAWLAAAPVLRGAAEDGELVPMQLGVLHEEWARLPWEVAGRLGGNALCLPLLSGEDAGWLADLVRGARWVVPAGADATWREGGLAGMARVALHAGATSLLVPVSTAEGPAVARVDIDARPPAEPGALVLATVELASEARGARLLTGPGVARAWTPTARLARLLRGISLVAGAAHALEGWRALLVNRPDGAKAAQFPRLGDAWVDVARTRAWAWSLLMRGPEHAPDADVALLVQGAAELLEGVLHQARMAVGAESLVGAHPLRRLRGAAALGASGLPG